MEIETPYLVQERNRHGNVRLYYRRKPYPRIRLYSQPGTPEFLAEYMAAANGTKIPPKEEQAAPKTRAPSLEKYDPGSLRDICVRYMKAPEFAGLGKRTQIVRRQILDRICLAVPKENPDRPAYGHWPAARMEARHLRQIRDENADRPEAANGMIKALRQVFGYAIEAGLPGIKENPARDVKYLEGNEEGFHSWTIEEVEQFEKVHPLGTKAHLALAVLLYTGQRRSDVVSFGYHMVRDGWLSFTQVKGKKRKPVRLQLPILPVLDDVIAATPGVGATWITSEYGEPYTAESFGNWFRDRCVEAGVPGRAHGLRKAAASRLAELGCSDREIMAITGHTTSKEVDRYTRAARQKVLAGRAMKKVAESAAKPRLRVVA